MMADPWISIVIPVWNRTDTIQRLIPHGIA